jgi:thiol-disulfide isomerase/thioredoxin
MTVDDPQARPPKRRHGAKPESPEGKTGAATAKPATSGGPGILLDPRVALVGSAVALIGVAVLAMFLWMVPTAAERELEAACRGLIKPQDREALERPLFQHHDPKGEMRTPAPDFTAKDMTGKDVKLSDYRGKVVLLNFWASWCGVCKTEKPSLMDMASDMTSDDFVVLTLVSDRDWTDALAALLETLAPGAVPAGKLSKDVVGNAYRKALPSGAPFKMLLDPPEGDANLGMITTSWGVRAVPESALIDRKGNIRAYFVNKRDWRSSVAQTCLRSVIDGG